MVAPSASEGVFNSIFTLDPNHFVARALGADGVSRVQPRQDRVVEPRESQLQARSAQVVSSRSQGQAESLKCHPE